MRRIHRYLTIAIAAVVVASSVAVLVISRMKDKKSDKDAGTVTDDGYVSSMRDSIRKDSVIIDSIIKEKDSLRNEYEKRIDSVIILSDSASVCFFREYIRLYKNGFREDKH